MTISLAFLAPSLVKAAIEGRLPRGIGVEQLRELPLDWSRQFFLADVISDHGHDCQQIRHQDGLR